MNRKYHDTFFRNHFIAKKLFTPEECSVIIQHFRTKNYTQASVLDPEKSKGNHIEGRRMDTVRKGHITFIEHSERETNFAFQKIYGGALWGNFGWSIFPLRFLQISEYDSETDGGFYKRHRDIIVDQNPQRIVTCVAQLSRKEDYTGCNLLFDAGKEMPTPDQFLEQGDAVFFLADEPHEVTPIQTGTRYSLTAWFTGPPFWNKENLPEHY